MLGVILLISLSWKSELLSLQEECNYVWEKSLKEFLAFRCSALYCNSKGHIVFWSSGKFTTFPSMKNVKDAVISFKPEFLTVNIVRDFKTISHTSG